MPDARTHVLHVVYSFSTGGLENLIVQLINHLPAHRFRHTVLALTTIGGFRDRVTAPDVAFHALNKPPGHAVPLYPRLYGLFRSLRPDVLHTCNLAALEVTPLAWFARVPLRVHAEHGWDAHDPHGLNPRYQRLRRLYRPFVSRYVAVSQELNDYLDRAVGVPQDRRSLVPNGVDTSRFAPCQAQPSAPKPFPEGYPFDDSRHFVFGTVGRMQTVKNQPLLAKAFISLSQQHPKLAARARLAMVGEGPLKAEVEQLLSSAGLEDKAWLPGNRDDVYRILPLLDCFVLPSQTEGTSCTLQEAMACGLPSIVTAVGGNTELVQHGVHGWQVPRDDVQALVAAMVQAMSEPAPLAAMRVAARRSAVDRFSLPPMLAAYESLFSRCLAA